MNNKCKNFDVVISGGGLSGGLLALSLSKLIKADGSLLSIAIVEKSVTDMTRGSERDRKNLSNETTQPLFDDRVLALSHGSAAYLKKVGLWQALQTDACAITDIDISDRGHFGKARISANEYGVNALGYVIDMALIGKAQLQLLAQQKNIHWFSPDYISDIDWQGQNNKNIIVKLNSGSELITTLLLGCDGVHSPCRQMANIESSHFDYQQCALIANVATTNKHNNKAFERFTEFGPIAMLPLQANAGESNRCSLVWTITPEQAERLQSLDEEAFKVELEMAFGSWLGAITKVGKRDVYPLVLLQAKQQVYHRMALVGNASHTIHPIAGQGFNLGLRDVESLASLINEALADKKDIGSFSLLQHYQKNRVKDQTEVIQLTDALVTLFANDLPPLVAGRNAALSAINFFKPLKNALVKKTMGY